MRTAYRLWRPRWDRVEAGPSRFYLRAFSADFIWRACDLLRTMRRLRLRSGQPRALVPEAAGGSEGGGWWICWILKGMRTQASTGIPGAARISPIPLRRSAKVRVPPDVQMVYAVRYRNQIISARTALSLRLRESQTYGSDGGLQEMAGLDLPVTMKIVEIVKSPVELRSAFRG